MSSHSPTRPLSHSPERGFTVMELTLVLTVLVVAAAVVLPGLPAFARGQRLRATAGRLAGLSRYAMQWSWQHGRELALSYDEQERRFRLEIAEQPAEPVLADPTPIEDQPEEEEAPHLDSARAVLQLPADVEPEGVEVAGEQQPPPMMSVRFLPDGRCDDAAILLCAGEARCTLRLDGRRGRVLVEEGDALEQEAPLGLEPGQ